ncbi:class I SAM-dependent methyltransferase [Mycobacterium sp. E3251]|uniref:class I SAM-dependent methyltransferase n=1 Tax=Mycobacterium sp. E3251 TaxID=1834144 RepID=UPI0018D383C5|nr:class I SAM-dependent methyltransferase [Mycobacterium sp. E3251]
MGFRMSAEQARERIGAALDAIDAAHDALRATSFRPIRPRADARRASRHAPPRGGTLRFVPPYRDVAAFDDRAAGYDRGWRGRLHHEIADRTAQLAVATVTAPEYVLDVGCGTGYLLQLLARRYPNAKHLAGIDPAPQMVSTARSLAIDPRLSFTRGVAEELNYADRAFDLVVSTTSFDHWSDQLTGLLECARVLRPGGSLVLVDRFSLWLLPTLAVGRRGKARTRRRVERLLLQAGFQSPKWQRLHAVIINAVTAKTRA